jgi:hypothetical protein
VTRQPLDWHERREASRDAAALLSTRQPRPPDPLASTARQRVTEDAATHLEEPLGVLSLELEQLTGGTPDLGERELNAPDLPLVPEAVLAGELELGVETSRLEGTPGDLVG